MESDYSLARHRELQGTPVGVLSAYSISPALFAKTDLYSEVLDPVHCLQVGFEYDWVRISSNHELGWVDCDGVRVRRDLQVEKELLEVLESPLLTSLTTVYPWIDPGDSHSEWLTCSSDDDWMWFLQKTVPSLEACGWRLETDPSFSVVVHLPEGWYVDLTEKPGGDRFEVRAGFELSNQRINILPFLLKSLRGGKSAEFLLLDDGRRVMIPRERIELLTATLLELLDQDTLKENCESVEVPWIRAMELASFQTLDNFSADLPRALKEKAERISLVANAPVIPVPVTLKAELRDYQQQGLNWLQLLCDAGFGAVLADDMGLGKTVQALAHVLIEKEAGRMKAPCLIIAPTSVLYNWESEAQKFAPSLKVHVSHGSERADYFEDFADYDLIVTSYPLLARDGEELLKYSFHLLILDEAQFVKNHRTIAARIVRLFKANQRIALTGTPLENNLDELWSLFSFVMPGLLGGLSAFRKYFRVPIEKEGNVMAREVLARRIAPFMLRRTKDEVAQELPPKSVIIQRIELTRSQKELYETVRASMEGKVRDAVREKGLAHSYMTVLDALLKMRQVCCHPKLLKLDAAKGIVVSAKLDALREMLQEMIPEGRRILLFSQFTSMLALIEAMLIEEKIGYVKITGKTKDRKTPVADFQTGTVPVFLISLKAGGTGLNLTAADTVIHYDPWWNPSVENQATDRAYRIGQDKPVFVYKLIASGTIEETIVTMQERKQHLISGLLGEQQKVLAKWSEEDMAELFKPLVACVDA